MSISHVRRWILIILGTLALGLGIVGVFVPLLPTTPLLLAAAACYLRSSDRMYGWLLNHRWFGPLITNYRQHRAITKKHKIMTLALLWATIGYSSIWATHNLVLRICLWAVAVGVTIHVLSLRTWKEGSPAAGNGTIPRR
jgi:uncharacterized membrane protein YbaN (DUF454 family)